VDKNIAHALELISASGVYLDHLSKWKWEFEKIRAPRSVFAKLCTKAHRTLGDAVVCMDRLWQIMRIKQDLVEVYTQPRHKRGSKIFGYFWQTCMDTLHELRVVSDAWTIFIYACSRGVAACLRAQWRTRMRRCLSIDFFNGLKMSTERASRSSCLMLFARYSSLVVSVGVIRHSLHDTKLQSRKRACPAH